MRLLNLAPPHLFRSIDFILTDMDETLTYQGRLAAATYMALERLRNVGVKVIPVTAAPAGWCDQMARMWPVESVIGENGGLFFRRNGVHDLQKIYWHDKAEQNQVFARLAAAKLQIMATVPKAEEADDQPFRLTSIAFKRSRNAALDDQILAVMRANGLDSTINNLWVMGWIGGYDKLKAASRIMQQVYGVNVEEQKARILYAGDSTNDAPMFSFFNHTVGVCTVLDYEAQIPKMPTWITDGPGGAGFVEIAEAVINAK